MTTPQTAKPVVLRKRTSVKEMNTAATVALVAMVIVVTAAFLFLPGKGAQPGELWEILLRKFEKNPLDTLMHAFALLVILGGLIVAYATRGANKAARLTLGPEGIDYRFPAPEWIPGITRKWFIPWAKLKDVQLHATNFLLSLHDGNNRHKLNILEWVEEGAPEPPAGAGFSLVRLQLTRKGRRALIDDSPLMRALRERGINPGDGTGETVVDYDLFSSPAARYVLIAIAVLAVYIFADGLLLDETWPNDPPYTALGVIGAVSAMVAVLFLYTRKVPAAVATGLGLLAGAVLMVAGYSGLLRINQLTDAGGMKHYEYEMRNPAHFYPVRDGDGLPPIELRPHALWSSQQNGSRHRFELRRGGLGFYQLNMAPVREAQQFYHEGYRGRPPARKPQ